MREEKKHPGCQIYYGLITKPAVVSSCNTCLNEKDEKKCPHRKRWIYDLSDKEAKQ